MSYSISDRVRELIVEIAEGRGLPTHNREGFIDYIQDLAAVLPIQDALGQVDEDLYAAYVRDQAVEARVEALSDR